MILQAHLCFDSHFYRLLIICALFIIYLHLFVFLFFRMPGERTYFKTKITTFETSKPFSLLFVSWSIVTLIFYALYVSAALFFNSSKKVCRLFITRIHKKKKKKEQWMKFIRYALVMVAKRLCHAF